MRQEGPHKKKQRKTHRAMHYSLDSILIAYDAPAHHAATKKEAIASFLRSHVNGQLLVTNIFPLDHKYNLLTQIFGMITNTFKRTHYPENVNNPTDTARVFHHVGNQLA